MMMIFLSLLSVCLGIDFGKFDEAARKKVTNALKDLDVGVLINNVGQSYDFCMYFDELSDEQVSDFICI